MARNGWKWLKLLEMVENGWNDRKRLELLGKGLTWLEMAGIVENG